VFKAAVKDLRLLSRCKAAIEVSRLLSRFRGRCRSVKAGIEVEAAIEVSRPLSRLSDWRGQVTGEVKAVDVKALSIDHKYVICCRVC
jgi:hypothetical protein